MNWIKIDNVTYQNLPKFGELVLLRKDKVNEQDKPSHTIMLGSLSQIDSLGLAWKRDNDVFNMFGSQAFERNLDYYCKIEI